VANDVELGIGIDTKDAEKAIDELTSSLKKMSKDAAKFEKDLVRSNMTELEKLKSARATAFSDIEKFYKSGVITAEKSAALRTEAEKKYSNDIKGLNEKNKSSFEKTFSAIKTAAAAALAVFSTKKLFDFFKTGIESAAEAEVAFAKMSKALELSGNNAPGVAETFDKLANNIERVTGVSAEAIQEQIGIAQAFGLTNDQTQKLIIAATELSAATGESLDASVTKLGATFNGTLGSLKKTVPELNNLSEESLKAGKAVDYIIERFGGTAAEKLKTFTGATQQLGIAFGKIPEAFGEAVVQNDDLRRAISSLTTTFYALADTVKGNQGGITNLIDVAVKPLVFSLAAAVQTIGILNTAINGIQLTAAGLGSVFLNVIAFAKNLDAEVAKTTFGGSQFKQAKEEADQAKLAADEYALALQLMNDQIIKDKKSLDEIVNSLRSYKSVTSETVSEIEKLAIAEADRKKRAKETEKALQGLGELEKKINADNANSLEKLSIARDEQLAQVLKFEKESGGASKKSNEIREKILDQYTKKYEEELLNLRGAEDRFHKESVAKAKQARDDQIRAVEQRQKEIQGILDNTNIFQQISLLFDESEAEDLKADILAIIGGISLEVGTKAVAAIANGQAGASSVADLVSNLISKVPVVGGLIAELVKLAGQAPEENKKNIQGFVKGIPEFLSNVNVNLGALNGILTEVIGPVIRKVIDEAGIGDLLSELFKNIVALPELIRTIALGVRDGLRGSGGELSDAFKKAIADTKAELGRFSENVSNFFSTFGNQLRSAFDFVFKNNPLLNELKSLKEFMARVVLVVEFIAQLFQTIPGAFVQIRDTINDITEKFNGAFEDLGSKFTDGFLQVRDQILSLGDGIATAFKDFPGKIKDALSDLFNGIKEAIQNAFSNDKLKPATDKLKGGGTGGIKFPGFATGITEVPSGFENDGFLARLSSGERVVDNRTNQDLKDFLANSRAGGLGNEQMIALLSEISSKIGNRSGTTIELTLDKKVLSKTILDLNRRNERLSV